MVIIPIGGRVAKRIDPGDEAAGCKLHLADRTGVGNQCPLVLTHFSVSEDHDPRISGAYPRTFAAAGRGPAADPHPRRHQVGRVGLRLLRPHRLQGDPSLGSGDLRADPAAVRSGRENPPVRGDPPLDSLAPGQTGPGGRDPRPQLPRVRRRRPHAPGPGHAAVLPLRPHALRQSQRRAGRRPDHAAAVEPAVGRDPGLDRQDPAGSELPQADPRRGRRQRAQPPAGGLLP